MRTKNGMNIEVATEIDRGSMTCGMNNMGDGWLKMMLCAEDASDLLKETLNKAQYFQPVWRDKVLSLCLHYVMTNGYTVRKAGC